MALDIFNPPRQDWIDGDDAYLRSGDPSGCAAGEQPIAGRPRCRAIHLQLGSVCRGLSEKMAITSPRAARPREWARTRRERTFAPRGCGSNAPAAASPFTRPDLEANLNVCPKCQYHFKIGARERIDLLLEPGYELVDSGSALDRSAEFHRRKALQAAAAQGAGSRPAWTTRF